MHKLLPVIAAAIILAGCSNAPAEAVIDEGVPASEIDDADDPIEQHFERREALLERQSREADALSRQYGIGEYSQDWDPWAAQQACETDSMTYDELDACNADVDAEVKRRDQRLAEYERRSAEMTERHDEEMDALDREFDELGGVTITVD
jgi:Skp family chaperone for outer membrane proteins